MNKKSTAITTEVIYPEQRTRTPVDVAVAKQHIKAEKAKADAEIVRELLNNPAVTIVGAYIVLEVLQKYKITGGGFTGAVDEGMVMTGVVAATTLKAIAPMLPDIIKSGSEGLGALLKAIGPLIEGAGMAAAGG
jgi:hypothetical protein